MAIHATIDVVSLNADVFYAWASVSPPLGWSENSCDGRARRYGQMRRPCVASNIKARTLCQSVKTFQGRIERARLARPARAQDRFNQCVLARTISDKRL